MSRPSSPPATADVLAVVHHAGGSCRVLVAAMSPPGPTILEAVELPAGDAGRLEACLEKHRADRVIVVLPASSVVCRTCTLPNAEPDQLDEALLLQAEAHLSPETPEHRWAMAVLAPAPGETSRSGIVVSWPEGGRESGAAGSESADDAGHRIEVSVAGRGITYTADVVALAALLDGLRPDEPLVWIDRTQGAVALAVTHAGGAVFRATREDLPGVTRVLAETALSVGHTGSFAEALVRTHEPILADTPPRSAALILPEIIARSAAERLSGAAGPEDAAWWTRYGIAAGGLLAAAGELAPLTLLQEAADREKPSRIRTITHAISQPRGALVTALACLLIAALTPAAMSGLRLGLLRLQYPDIDEQTRVLEDAQSRIAMYRALEGQAWSMTKLLSDIVTNTPEGIELESIRVLGSDRSFSVSGLARGHEGRTGAEVLTGMQDNLSDCRLFGEIRLNWEEPNRYGHLEFELSAKIVNPHWRPSYAVELDFGEWTLARRQAGKGPETHEGEDGEPAPGGSEAPADVAMVEPDATTDDGDAALADAVASNDDGGGDAAEDRETPSPRRARPLGPGGGTAPDVGRRSDEDVRAEASGAGPGAIPEPLTQAQINAMTIEEVRARQIEISNARRRVRRSGDKELDERLKTEFYMLQSRLRDLSGRS